MIVSFAFIGCSNQSTLEKFPMQIEFGAIGKGSTWPPTIFKIDMDSIRITTRGRKFSEGVKHYSISTNKTQFVELLSIIDKNELKGEKHYYNPFIVDGEYMKLTSRFGQRKFSNVFSSMDEKSNIKPDTLGLSKFESLSKHAISVLEKIDN